MFQNSSKAEGLSVLDDSFENAFVQKTSLKLEGLCTFELFAELLFDLEKVSMLNAKRDAGPRPSFLVARSFSSCYLFSLGER